MSVEPTYFDSPGAFGRWLSRHHDSARELWVGYYKKATGTPSLTWPESVDEALCYGWIDGKRKRVDDSRYTIRFTPRRAKSHWSAVNLGRVKVLVETGRMQPAGLAAYTARDPARADAYAYENRPHELPRPLLAQLKANPAAWTFYRARPPSYRRAATWWVLSAKRADTRDRRLRRLIDDSAAGRTIGPLTLPSSSS
jgi:uncharacterized protein YdeI (YjbR/CyaY-like superfamily)